MLNFNGWRKKIAKKSEKKRENEYVKSTYQGSSEGGYVYQQGKADRNPEAIEHEGIYYFPEP
jgi:hypothetical protein